MKRNILTALDTIEENIRYVREQLDMDVSALTSAASVAGTFHGAQEILREHALKIKQELPDVIRDVCVWFCTDLHAEQCNAVAQNYFNAIGEEGSRSPDVDNIYTYFAGLVRSAGVKGASLSFEDLTELYWVAFQDMYQTAIRDLRKTTVEIPEMMVTVYSSHIDDKFDENPRVNRVVAAYAYDGLLCDVPALNKFLDEVYAKVNAVRLTDGVSLDGFMVTCPEVVGYQLWAARTGGFPALMGTRLESPLAIKHKPAAAIPVVTPNEPASSMYPPTAALSRNGEIIEAVSYEGDFDCWMANIERAVHRVQRTTYSDGSEVVVKFAALTPELQQALTKFGIIVNEAIFQGPLEVLMQHTPAGLVDKPATPVGPLDVLADLNIGRSSELLNFARQCITEHEERDVGSIDLDEAIQLQLITTTEVQPKVMLVTFKMSVTEGWLQCVALYSPDSYLAATRACVDHLTVRAVKDGVQDQITSIEVLDYYYPDGQQ